MSHIDERSAWKCGIKPAPRNFRAELIASMSLGTADSPPAVVPPHSGAETRKIAMPATFSSNSFGHTRSHDEHTEWGLVLRGNIINFVKRQGCPQNIDVELVILTTPV